MHDVSHTIKYMVPVQFLFFFVSGANVKIYTNFLSLQMLCKCNLLQRKLKSRKRTSPNTLTTVPKSEGAPNDDDGIERSLSVLHHPVGSRADSRRRSESVGEP